MLTKRSLLLAAAAIVPLLGLSDAASAKDAKKLGLAVAMILALGWWGAGVGISMRGPPRRAPTVVSGRAILTRFCVIRC